MPTAGMGRLAPAARLGRAIRVTGALPACWIAAACGGTAPSPPRASALEIVPPAVVYSGEPASVRITAKTSGGAPVAALHLVLEAGAGALVSPSDGTTGADGSVTVTWTTADRDEAQVFTATAGPLTRTIGIVTEPRLVALDLAPADTTLPDFGADLAPRITGRTPTNRTVTVNAPGIVDIVAEARTLPQLAVLERTAAGFRSLGPGQTSLRAVKNGVTSNLITVTVPVARPVILAPPSPAALVPGGTFTLEGVGLDLIPPDGFFFDGQPTTVLTRDAGTATLGVPDQSSECVGDAYATVTVPDGWVPLPLDFVVDRPGSVALAPGTVRQLTEAGAVYCLRLAPAASAEYVLVYTDTRSIEAARAAPGDPTLRSAFFTLRLSDRTAGAPAASTRMLRVPSTPSDVRSGTARLFGPPPPDWTGYRTTPWAQGDRVSVFWNGSYDGGQIIRATSRLAFAVFDRDAALAIPSRLIGFDAGLELFGSYGVPALEDAFGPEWPATTEATGQTLVFLTPLDGAGGLAAILRHHTQNGVLNQDVVLLLNPAIGPGTGDIFFDWGSLVHEMAHAMQDRHALVRCRDHADCGGDWFGNRWATEGGAELVKEEAIRRSRGLSRTGNYARTVLDQANLYGFRAFWGGLEAPHWDWGWGYSSTTFALGFLLDQAIAAGGAYDAVLQALSRGAFENWFGYNLSLLRRPGLQERLAPWLGPDWDPSALIHQAAMAVALDDVISDPAYQMPMVAGMAAFFDQAGRFVSGNGASLAVVMSGDTFAHYRIDDRGRGGSYLIESEAAGLRWAIARVR